MNKEYSDKLIIAYFTANNGLVNKIYHHCPKNRRRKRFGCSFKG